MRIYLIKPHFQKFLTPLKNVLVSIGAGPTSLNILGVVSALLMGVSLYFSQVYDFALLLVPVFAFFRISANALDGMIARDLKEGSRFGEVLNEFLDRISDVLIFGSFLWVGNVNTILVALTITFMLLSSYLGILSKAVTGVRLYKGLMCKADRMFYLSLGALLIYFFQASVVWASWGLVLLLILLALMYTVIERCVILYRTTQ